MATVETRRLKLWQGRIETEVEIAGNGPPLVYLHGPWGLAPDRAFVARLAGSNTVYAPKFPGTSRGDTEAAHALDSWLDLVVYYGELFDALKLAAPARRRPLLRRLARRRNRRRQPKVGRPPGADRSGRPVA